MYLLLTHEGKYVNKELIMQHIWEGRIVSEGSITQSISQLRLVLDDSGKEQKIIKTKPRERYMLLLGNILLKTSPPTKDMIKSKEEALIISSDIELENRRYIFVQDEGFKSKVKMFLCFYIQLINFYYMYDLFSQKERACRCTDPDKR